jgi:hypothetical protein
MIDGPSGGHLRLVTGPDGGEESDEDDDPNDTAHAEEAELPASAISGRYGSDQMEDKDVQRLEDRIAATEERGQLRLELSITKIDGKLDAVIQSIHEVSRFSAAQAVESAARHRELRNTIIATGVAVVFGIVATLFGLKQVWIGGVEVGLPLGQATQTHPVTGSTPNTSPAAAPPGQAPAPAGHSQSLPPASSPTPTSTKPNG